VAAFRKQKHFCAVKNSEAAMGVKASEVGNWLRQRAGKRDHREIM